MTFHEGLMSWQPVASLELEGPSRTRTVYRVAADQHGTVTQPPGSLSWAGMSWTQSPVWALAISPCAVELTQLAKSWLSA
ncbi:hypothetical protein PQR15_33030 [Streptomyces lydicus]|nr:hypothetical protein [Streptomyces lydicus]